MNRPHSNDSDPSFFIKNAGLSEWQGGTLDAFGDPWYRFVRVLRALDGLGAVRAGSSILDLGCHQGQFLTLAQARFGAVCSGVDAWSAELKTDNSWHYVQADLSTGIPFASAAVELISCLEVIEHLIDTDQFLIECARVLRSDGLLIITTPNINSLRNRFMVPFGIYPAGLEYRNVIHHVRLYNLKALTSHLDEHGFDIVMSAGVSFLPQRFNRSRGLRMISEFIAKYFPKMCSNLIVIARKRRSTE